MSREAPDVTAVEVQTLLRPQTNVDRLNILRSAPGAMWGYGLDTALAVVHTTMVCNAPFDTHT